MIKYLIDNKEWIFSGIGVLTISLILGIITKRKLSRKKNNIDSTLIKVDGNTHIGDESKGSLHNDADQKNILRNNNIETKGDFHLGDKSN